MRAAVWPTRTDGTVRRHHPIVNTVPLCSRRYRYCEVHLLMDGVRKARSRRGCVETLAGRAARARAAGAVLLARSPTSRGARASFLRRAAAFAIRPSARDAGPRGVELDDGCLFAASGADTPDPGDGYAVTSAATPPAAGGSGPVLATITRNHLALLDSECGDQRAVPGRARPAKPPRAAFAMRSRRSRGIRAACKCRGSRRTVFRDLERTGAGDDGLAREPAEHAGQGEEAEQRGHSECGQGADHARRGGGVPVFTPPPWWGTRTLGRRRKQVESRCPAAVAVDALRPRDRRDRPVGRPAGGG